MDSTQFYVVLPSFSKRFLLRVQASRFTEFFFNLISIGKVLLPLFLRSYGFNPILPSFTEYFSFFKSVPLVDLI